MLIKDKKELKKIVNDLVTVLKQNKNDLFELNKNITNDSVYYIEEDFNSALQYLKKYIKNNYNKNKLRTLKPKGSLLIVLSYNEPFILSIVPIMNALVTGNDVTVKVSKGTEKFFQKIWADSNIINKYGFRLKFFIDKTHAELHESISDKQAVYFFGSLDNAKKMAKTCSEKFVEFFPEVEAADLKIYNSSKINILDDVKNTLNESFTHHGQSCQRIHGVVVNEKYYDLYTKEIKDNFSSIIEAGAHKYVNEKFTKLNKESIEILNNDIEESNYDNVLKYKNSLPVVVLNPDYGSELALKGYFLPVLCVFKYKNVDQLIKTLNKRRYFLGLNIISDDEDEIDTIINATRFTRYTVNTNHVEVRPDEGWGGSLPSGFHGYKKWIYFFTNSFTIIK